MLRKNYLEVMTPELREIVFQENGPDREINMYKGTHREHAKCFSVAWLFVLNSKNNINNTNSANSKYCLYARHCSKALFNCEHFTSLYYYLHFTCRNTNISRS